MHPAVLAPPACVARPFSCSSCSARSASGWAGQVRGHLRLVGMKPRAAPRDRRPARDRHQRADRWARRRPRIHRIHLRHAAAARRRAARAAGDRRFSDPAPHARPPRPRRPRGAAEGAPRADPARSKSPACTTSTRPSCGSRARAAPLLITVDHNLALVAEALRVPVAQVNALASRFRTPVSAGDETQVRLVREGRDHGQAVGYLRPRHDGRGRGRDRGDRVAGDRAGAQRDPDHHRSDDLRDHRGNRVGACGDLTPISCCGARLTCCAHGSGDAGGGDHPGGGRRYPVGG